MTKLLNLDDIVVDSQRIVKFKGVDYKVVDFDLQGFIAFQQHFKAFGAAYNSTNLADMQVTIDETVEMVKLGIPDFPHDQIKHMNPLQMLALVSMVANMMPDPDEETQVGMEKKDQQEGQAE